MTNYTQPLKLFTVVTLEHAVAALAAIGPPTDPAADAIKIEHFGLSDFAPGYDEHLRVNRLLRTAN